MIFGLIGGLMFYKSLQTLRESSEKDPNQTFMKEEKAQFFFYSSFVVLAAALLSFVLDKEWVRNYNFLLKVPIYGLVAMSLTFLITFGIVDIINFLISYFQSKNASNIVESQDQIMSALAVCYLGGLVYGLVFGLMDIEDDRWYNLQKDFFYEEWLCLPIGGILGVIGGFVNELLRNNVITFLNLGRKIAYYCFYKRRPL